jgi:hypothetical protein
MVKSQNDENSQTTITSFSDIQQAMRMQHDLWVNVNSTTNTLVDQHAQQSLHFQETMARVLQSTLQIYQAVLQSETNLPPQVMRQQPVYLLDAKGFELPFHLEFITSREVSSVIQT